MQQITIVLTTSNGVVIRKTLTKPEGKPIQLSLPPGAKISVEVKGPSAASLAPSTLRDHKLVQKKSGADLVIEGEGEALVRVSDFYNTKDVALGNLSWDYAEPQPMATQGSPASTEATASPSATSQAKASAMPESPTAAADGAATVAPVKPTASSGMGTGLLALGAALGLGGGGGGGGGGSAANTAASTVISGTITAGPVVKGKDMLVEFFKADGTKITSTSVDDAGHYKTDLGNYSGVVIIRVTGAGAEADFMDEATQTKMHLDATLLAVGSVAPGASSFQVNPLTTVAAQKAGLSSTGSPPPNLSVAAVASANAAVAKALGLSGDVSQMLVTTSRNATGDAQAPNELGAILAAISGMAAKLGSQQGAISALIGAIDTDGGLSSTGVENLLEGARATDPPGNPTVSSLVNHLINHGLSADGFAIDKMGTSGDNVLTSGVLIADQSYLSGRIPTGTSVSDLSLKFGSSITITQANGLTVDTAHSTWKYTLKATDVAALLGGLTQGVDGPESITLWGNGGTKPKAILGLYYNNGADDQPLAVTFANVVTSIDEAADISSGVKLADIVIFDPDGYKGNGPTLTNSAAGVFEIRTNGSGKYELWLAKDASLNYVSHPNLSAAVTAGTTQSNDFTLSVLLSAPTAQLLSDTGSSQTDHVTSEGTLQIKGIHQGATWSYSSDGGAHWTQGTGNSLTLTQDGTYNLLFKQTYGSQTSVVDASKSYTVTLDTTAPASIISGFDKSGNTSDGVTIASLTDVVGTGMTHSGWHWQDNHCALLEGTSEAFAAVVFTLGGESKTVTADSTGYWNYRMTADDFANVGVGDESITVISATDQAGNVSTTQVTHQVHFNAIADTVYNPESGYGSPYIDALISGGTGWDGLTLTYSFAPGAGLAAWTDTEKAAFVHAFHTYENICKVHFVEGTYSSDGYAATSMVFNKAPGSEWDDPGNGGTVLADFWLPHYGLNEEGNYIVFGALQGRFNYEFSSWNNLTPGGMGFDTIIHELGHGLGLDHPFDGSPTFPGVDLDKWEDLGDNNLNQGIWTMMAYTHGWQNSPGDNSWGYNWGYSKTPMTFDVAALQTLYGANLSYKTGNDLYVLPTQETIGTGWECIWDAGGVDTLTNDGASSACQINLNAYPVVGGLTSEPYVSYNLGSAIAGGFTIAEGVTIENATGGSGDDRLIGNQVDNVLTGGAGNDTLTGGEGADRFVFNAALNPSSNVDILTDFSVSAGDLLELSAAVFSKLAGEATLATSQFKSGAGLTVATDVDDYILYNTSTGDLYYDSDGSGASAAVLFAVLQNRPIGLSASQFVVI